MGRKAQEPIERALIFLTQEIQRRIYSLDSFYRDFSPTNDETSRLCTAFTRDVHKYECGNFRFTLAAEHTSHSEPTKSSVITLDSLASRAERSKEHDSTFRHYKIVILSGNKRGLQI